MLAIKFEFSSLYFEILRPFAHVGPVTIFGGSTQRVPVQQSVHENPSVPVPVSLQGLFRYRYRCTDPIYNYNKTDLFADKVLATVFLQKVLVLGQERFEHFRLEFRQNFVLNWKVLVLLSLDLRYCTLSPLPKPSLARTSGYIFWRTSSIPSTYISALAASQSSFPVSPKQS